MKSRISYFNKGAFRKNMTRFAPAWVLYTVFLLMCLLMISDSGDYWVVSQLSEFIQISAATGCAYALLVGELLFGDLYNSRMCNALHAMPLRREGWFLVNVSSGLLFHLIPSVIMALAAIPMVWNSSVRDAWTVALYWLLGSNLQYICFFGIAVFSAYCVGSRFAQAVVYGILNFGSMIACWLVDTLYTPMLYGLQTSTDPFFWFSPVIRMAGDNFIYTERVYAGAGERTYSYGLVRLGENWWYVWICALIGVALMLLGLQLYRKRKLECAGDFIAVKAFEPVFLVVYTLVVGAMFHLMCAIFMDEDMLLFLFIGLVIGYFTGQMLLKRTIRVFSGKSLVGCVAVVAAFALSLVITALDLFGVTTWVPKAENVVSARISQGHYAGNDGVTLTGKADIENVLAIHRTAIEGSEENFTETAQIITSSEELIETYYYCVSQDITLTYTLTDGRTVSRYYTVWLDEDAGQLVQHYMSSAEAVLGMTRDQALDFADQVESVYVFGEECEYSWDQDDFQGLMEAVIADCEAGTMAQSWSFHQNNSYLADIEFLYHVKKAAPEESFSTAIYIRVFDNAENTVNWLMEHGLEAYFIQE